MLTPGKHFHLLFALLNIALLAGCVNTPGIPEDHFYRLPEFSGVTQVNLPGIESIGVDQIQADGLYRERSILYVNEDNRLELKPYHYRYWTMPPADIIQQHLIRYLRKALPGKKIVRYQAGEPVDAIIRGRIIHFERIIQQDSSRVVTSLELVFLRSGQLSDSVAVQEYDYLTEPGKKNLNDSLQQFGFALTKNYEEFLSTVQQFNAQGSESFSKP